MVGKKYINTEDNKTYILVEWFKRVTKDWNCDGEVYMLEVCYMRDIREECPSFNIPVDRYEFKTEYKLVE